MSISVRTQLYRWQILNVAYHVVNPMHNYTTAAAAAKSVSVQTNRSFKLLQMISLLFVKVKTNTLDDCRVTIEDSK